ncbi:MAG TPA: DUF839 domain-containing protein [Dermatophilaceae bacterium]|nr:DUF839 domain-containing protein [Dermatophilaceae bacterium]
MENNVLTPSARQVSVAWGALPLVNPDAANGVTHYGYNTAAGGPLTQATNEARKTEPDKNVYLVMGGHHYLYQGHELGPRGYVTRVDLDQPDPAKRVSLVADVDTAGGAFPTIDGITWNPFTRQLLATSEAKAPNGGVFAIDLDANGDPVTAAARRLPALGAGGYEGIQCDSDGNLWIVEDIGGAAASGGKVPNSYVYRFVPTDRSDLTRGGVLQALQIARPDGTPITAAQVQTNPADTVLGDLHRLGTTFRTTWVDVHSTGSLPYDATAAAKAAGATPLKRPENGVFRPGSGFREFYFTETGDTNANSTLPGAYGGVFRLTQDGPSAATGRLSIVIVGDKEHTGFDNIAFASADALLVVEDAGDTLHGQRNALDSGYLLNLRKRSDDDDEHGDGSRGRAPQLIRWLAEGRDASATFDAMSGPSYNDGDNEITGIHVSDGDPSVGGLLGVAAPDVSKPEWRTFWTQQHGDNVTWEISWSIRR